MTPQEEFRLTSLLEKQLNENLSRSEMTELENLVLNSDEARDLYVELASQHAGLLLLEESLVQESLQEKTAQVRKSTKSSWWKIGAAALVFLAAGFAIHPALSRFQHVAVLVDSENASWVSSLPTTPRSRLPQGYLELKSGVATIRFLSGASLVLEAPAKMYLESRMRCRLEFGSAVIEAPDSAHGFVVETPDGYAVDHGTRFAVAVSPGQRSSAFEVVDGEISVLSRDKDREMRLKGNERALLKQGRIEKMEQPFSETSMEPDSTHHLVRPDALANLIQNNEVNTTAASRLLVKKSINQAGYDRRCLLSFDLSGVDKERIKSAGLHLALVPCNRGFAAHLPKVNQFSVYGVSNPQQETWTSGIRWETAPTPERSIHLGTFTVSRSLTGGSFGIRTPELLNFLKSDDNDRVTFILCRDTSETHSGGMIHAFGGSDGLLGPGPVLELVP
ncbi:MAG: hypothetical protein P1V20_32195 [Verrucomicrobiales bacterium]|nr:hypothetical protein [Verrucomicrobiales bacterium]